MKSLSVHNQDFPQSFLPAFPEKGIQRMFRFFLRQSVQVQLCFRLHGFQAAALLCPAADGFRPGYRLRLRIFILDAVAVQP